MSTGITVERISPDHLAIILPWWSDRGEGEMQAELLPPLGVVAIDDDGPAAAAWLAEIRGCPVAIIDWLVGRPGLSAKKARRASRAVFEVLERDARVLGVRMLFAAAYRQSISREARQCGFTELCRDVINLAKPLSAYDADTANTRALRDR